MTRWYGRVGRLPNAEDHSAAGYPDELAQDAARSSGRMCSSMSSATATPKMRSETPRIGNLIPRWPTS